MASFASQLKGMFFALVERITGYGAGTGGEEQVRRRTEDGAPVAHTHEIRPRGAGDPSVPGGSEIQVN
ncbi:hypothetical protein PAHAL_7G308600 [Panicum hallii]|jgi:hypothetical protein|uniref:Uncharacterized protein n=1 Tax=Panicum hallii TaxID=206008 RepID=A0A2S3IAT6_9POAL|nr:hypothetical protein PAHAL_7G308600 [Panicum hallii]